MSRDLAYALPTPTERSPLIAGLLSAFVPGLGQAYNRQWGKAIAFHIFAFLIVPWIISIVDAVKVARVQLTLESGSGPAGYLPAYVPETLDVQLARIAAQRGGEVTVAEGALATGRSFDEVEAALDKMMHDGHVDIGNRPDTGVIVYRFL
ncbi:MAG: hypothetical protein KC503_03800 [Myxococcales bacterium]|nr:hypothetical protein [Myxococcales bacterium]